MAENKMVDMGTALDWDDQVTDDGGFTLLDEGVYPFMVTEIEKARFEGSEKMAPCPKAVISITIDAPGVNGLVTIKDSLLLSTKVQWRIAKFFEGLGFQKDPATGAMPMRWNEVVGKTGYVKVGIREYVKKDGSKGQANQVEEYLPPEKWPTAAPAAQPAPVQQQPMQMAQPMYQQQAMQVPTQPAQYQNPSTQFTAGSF